MFRQFGGDRGGAGRAKCRKSRLLLLLGIDGFCWCCCCCRCCCWLLLIVVGCCQLLLVNYGHCCWPLFVVVVVVGDSWSMSFVGHQPVQLSIVDYHWQVGERLKIIPTLSNPNPSWMLDYWSLKITQTPETARFATLIKHHQPSSSLIHNAQ